MRKKLALLLSLSAVSACGGSGGSVEQSISFDTSPIRLFADDSGIARYTAVSDGEVVTGYLSAPELAFILSELEATGEVAPVDLAGLTQVASGPNTTISTGAFTVDGGVLNVLAAFTTAEDAGLVLFEEPTSGLTLLQTVGEQATNIPSGGVSYSGVLGLQNVFFDEVPEIGEFTAIADFSGTPDIFLSGSTDSYDVSGTALITGSSFSSAGMTISDGFGSTSASMNGDFHGDGANSVAGVIYSNDAFGDFRGGFVGSQD